MRITKWIVTFLGSWIFACLVLALRATCRVRLHGDPRSIMRLNNTRYVYCVLHAHQVSAIMDGEPGTGAMVSRSSDGQLIVPALRMRGIVPIRGSGIRKGTGSKGGLAALDKLIDHVNDGHAAFLAVDGPAGPRGFVHKGAAVLAQRTDAAIITLVAVPSRRWILSNTWDRIQIPKPFCTIDAYFGKPMFIQPDESSEAFRRRIEDSLRELERQHDSAESGYFVGNPNLAAAS